MPGHCEKGFQSTANPISVFRMDVSSVFRSISFTVAEASFIVKPKNPKTRIAAQEADVQLPGQNFACRVCSFFFCDLLFRPVELRQVSVKLSHVKSVSVIAIEDRLVRSRQTADTCDT